MSSGGTSPSCVSPSSIVPLAPFSAAHKGGPGSIPGTGTVIPNRVFVGGFAANTTEEELKEFFSHFGAVRDTKIIHDRAGVSKGYGFVTFETQDDAEKIINKESQNLILKDRKLNIGPAIKKQQTFPRLFEGTSPAAPVMFAAANGAVPYMYQGGIPVYNSGDTQSFPSAQQAQPQAAAYPTMVVPTPQVTFLPQTPYQYQTPAAGQQWTGAWPARWGPQNPMAGGAGYMYPVPAADMMYAPPPAQTYVDMSDGAMVESAHTENRLCRYSVNTTMPKTNCKPPLFEQRAPIAQHLRPAQSKAPQASSGVPPLMSTACACVTPSNSFHQHPLRSAPKLAVPFLRSAYKDSNVLHAIGLPTPPVTPQVL